MPDNENRQTSTNEATCLLLIQNSPTEKQK